MTFVWSPNLVNGMRIINKRRIGNVVHHRTAWDDLERRNMCHHHDDVDIKESSSDVLMSCKAQSLQLSELPSRYFCIE